MRNYGNSGTSRSTGAARRRGAHEERCAPRAPQRKDSGGRLEAPAERRLESNRILHSESGHNTVFDLKVGSEQTKAMIVDWQYEPIKGTLMHIDLKRIAMDKALRVGVPVQLTGVPEGVKTQGGILEQMLREVEIECLPADIPDHIDVDVTALVFGQVLRVSDLPRNDKVKFVSDENQPVAHITAVKEVVEAAPAEATAEAAATPAEPEVIKKGKQETEEGAPEAGKAEGGKKPEGKKKE